MSKAHKLECEIMNCRRELRALGVGMPGDEGVDMPADEDELSVLARKIDGADDKYTVSDDILVLLKKVYVLCFRAYMEGFDLKYQGMDYDLYNVVISDSVRRYKFLITISVGHAALDVAHELNVYLKVEDKYSADGSAVVAEEFDNVSDFVRYISSRQFETYQSGG